MSKFGIFEKKSQRSLMWSKMAFSSPFFFFWKITMIHTCYFAHIENLDYKISTKMLFFSFLIFDSSLTVYWKYKPVFLLSKHQNMIGYMYRSVKILSTHTHTYHPLNKVKFKFKYKQPSISFIYIHINNACSHVLSSMYIWYVFMTHF